MNFGGICAISLPTFLDARIFELWQDSWKDVRASVELSRKACSATGFFYMRLIPFIFLVDTLEQ